MQSLPIIIYSIQCPHKHTYCRAALWTSTQGDAQVFASNLHDLRLNAHTRNFATFSFVFWELLSRRMIRCFLGSRTLIMSGRYLLLNWLHTGHWNTKCISVSCWLARNGHVTVPQRFCDFFVTKIKQIREDLDSCPHDPPSFFKFDGPHLSLFEPVTEKLICRLISQSPTKSSTLAPLSQGLSMFLCPPALPHLG